MPPVARAAVFFLVALVVVFLTVRAFARARYVYHWSKRAANRYAYGVFFLGLLLAATLIVPAARVMGSIVGLLLVAWVLAPSLLRRLGWPPMPPLDDRL